MVLGNFAAGLKTLIAGAGAFVAGTFGWSAVSGLLAGALEVAGVHTPASTWLTASPIVGAVLALFAVGHVSGGGT